MLIQLYTFGVSMRTFTKQTQCHLADGVKDGGEDLVRVKLLDISFYKLCNALNCYTDVDLCTNLFVNSKYSIFK